MSEGVLNFLLFILCVWGGGSWRSIRSAPGCFVSYRWDEALLRMRASCLPPPRITTSPSTTPSPPPFFVCRWDEALAAYEGKLVVTQPSSQEYLTALLGKMRCLASLAEWEKLSSLCRWVFFFGV